MTSIVLTQNRPGSRILVSTPYDPVVVELMKKIPGAKYERDQRAWSYPRSWATCLRTRELATATGRKLTIKDEKLLRWAQHEKERQSNFVDLSDIHSVQPLDNVAPELYAAMQSRPFQTTGAKFMTQQGSALLADDPGLGKTLQTIAAFMEAEIEGPILVVTNKSSQQITWPNELARWAPEDRVFVFDAEVKPANREATIKHFFDIHEQGLVDHPRTWVIANPYWLRMKAETDQYGKYIYSTTGVKMLQAEVPEMFKHEWAGIVADESHETLATNTGNAKKWSQQRQGLGALKVKEGGLKISISGTPMRGKPENMFGQLNWLRPEEYKFFWGWAKEHFNIIEDTVRVKGGATQDTMAIGELRDESAFYRALSTVLIRRSKGQVAADLPPKLYGGTPLVDGSDVIGVWLPVGGVQKNAYDKMLQESILLDGDLELSAVGILAETTRLKQLATASGKLVEELQVMYEIGTDDEYVRDENGRRIPLRNEFGEKIYETVTRLRPTAPSNKLNWLINFLDERDLLGAGAKGSSKIIVASQFRQVIDLFRKILLEEHGTESFAITGETDAKHRKSQQDAFQNDPNSLKIFFLQSVAGGTSLTLDQADDVIILDEMWNPDIQEQIEDRAHRLSRVDHNVTVWYVRSLGTIEEHIGATVADRNNTCKGIMDGQRGIDFRKKILGR